MLELRTGICDASGFRPYYPTGTSPGFLSTVYGDKRLSDRLSALRSSVLEDQHVVIHQLSKARAERKAYYRLIHNAQLEIAQMAEELVERTSHSYPGEHILLLQDTSEISYKGLKGRLRDNQGIGRLANKDSYGYHLHPCLGVDAASGFPVGIYDVQIWHRDETLATYDDREGEALPFEQKSSYRWLTGALRSRRRLDEQTAMTVVSDRESDIYESMAEMKSAGIDFVIRSQHNRGVNEPAKRLKQHVQQLPIAAHLELSVQLDSRFHSRAGKRQATLALRYGPFRMKRPYKAAASGIRRYPQELALYVVDVEEVSPTTEPPIHWRLITTHPVETPIQAQQIIRYYQLRWHIEQLFRLLKKQGLDIESLQLERGPAIIRMGLIALEAAMRIMQLDFGDKSSVPIPIDLVFTPQQIHFLHLLNQKYQGKTTKQKNLHPPDQLQWATWIIARIGGWKGYKTESRPGPKTFRIGWQKFQQWLTGFLMAHY